MKNLAQMQFLKLVQRLTGSVMYFDPVKIFEELSQGKKTIIT